MVLDPLSALAVGSSVVQFLEFSSKLISKATELYKGSRNALIDIQELHDVSQRLTHLNEDLLTTRRCLRARVKLKSVPRSEAALEQVSLECSQIAEEFSRTLEELLAPVQHKAWKSCRQAFKSIWNKNGLEAMQRRLGQQREQPVVHLLVVIRRVSRVVMAMVNSFSVYSNNQLESLGEVHNENRRLEAHILDAMRSSSAGLRDDLAGFVALLPGRQSASNGVKQNWKHWQEAHRDELLCVFADFSCHVESEKEKQIRDYILSTLHFPQLRDRELRIQPAHAQTFDWIFGSSSQQKPFSDFAKWVENPSTTEPIYWVAGKPGS